MYASLAVMCMTRQLAIPITASHRELLLKIFRMIGFARSAVSAKRCS